MLQAEQKCQKPLATPTKQKRADTIIEPKEQDIVDNSPPKNSKPRKKKKAKTSGTTSQKIPSTPKVATEGKIKKVMLVVSQTIEEELGMAKNITSIHIKSDSSNPDMEAPKEDCSCNVISNIKYTMPNTGTNSHFVHSKSTKASTGEVNQPLEFRQKIPLPAIEC
ncbi:hypothetical protein RYX36_019360 [Vicia faba]